MRFVRTYAAVFLSFALTISVLAQQTAPSVQRDPQAIAILNQCLAAAGGIQAISAIQDVTATGTITYDGLDQQGSATIKVLGLHRFRLDASLPDGSHSYVVGKDAAFHKNPDGSTSPMPPQNAIKPASVTFPLFQVLAAVQDISFSVTDGGVVTHNGQQVHDIVVQQTFSADKDRLGGLSKVTKAHIYIDPNALSVQAIEDQAFRRDGEPGEAPHEMQFSDYQTVNGILAPFSVVEFVAGQKLSTTQIKQISFNTGLAEADFQ